VHVADIRQARTDVHELVDARLRRQVPDGPAQEARFSRTEMRTVGQTPSTRSVVLAVGGEVILAAQRLFVHTLDAAEIVCV
jgi:shikimate kinase